MNGTFHDAVVEQLPNLRAFARMLARDRALADDLVQETMVRALSHADQFEQGTNMKAWLSTILRNSYFNEMRHRARVRECQADLPLQTASRGEQESRLEMRDFERAFETLPALQREALALVGASGFSYEDAASMANCAVGTMKSRVCRARAQLHDMLEGEAAIAVAQAA